MKINGNPDGGSGGGLTPQQEAALQPLVNRNNGILTTDITTRPQSVGFAEAPGSDQYDQLDEL